MTYETVASWAGTFGTILVGLFFLGVLIFIFRPGSKKVYEELARVPLQDDENDIGERKNG